MRIASKSPEEVVTTSDAAERLFLSPQWIHQVARAVESVKGADEYLRQLTADYSLGVMYVIRSIPTQLRRSYGGCSEAVVSVRLHKGTVRRIAVGGKPHQIKVDVVATMDYGTAKNLFTGKARPSTAFLSGQVRAQPAKDFRLWAKLAARSIVTANRVLKIARTVPTVFE